MLRLAPRSFARWFVPTRAELGYVGERLAARAARRRGLTCLAHDVRTAFGQVDLVLRDGATLVCAEVKTALVDELDRPIDDAFRPGRRLDGRRWERQRRAGEYLAARLGEFQRSRVDLIEVWIERETWRWRARFECELRHPPRLKR